MWLFIRFLSHFTSSQLKAACIILSFYFLTTGEMICVGLWENDWLKIIQLVFIFMVYLFLAQLLLTTPYWLSKIALESWSFFIFYWLTVHNTMDVNTEFENSYTDYLVADTRWPVSSILEMPGSQMLFYEIQTVYHEFNSRNCSLDGHTQCVGRFIYLIYGTAHLTAVTLGHVQRFKPPKQYKTMTPYKK